MKITFTYSFVLALSLAGSSLKAQQADEAKINRLIQSMTLEEKIGMLHASSSFTSGGVARLGVRELNMSDGPHGVRAEHGRDWTMDNAGNDSATYLPTGITLAATWNRQLGYAFGEVLGSEAKFRGKDIILGPAINMMRTPLNGRNFEYLTEDPFLAAVMATGYVKGVQGQGVAACVKHFMANNQETKRTSIDVQMSERALREIYLPAFRAAVVDGGAYTIMGAYNKFRGQYCTYNDYLVNTILKGEWGFKGAMISDWGAIHETRAALLGGADIEMGTDLGMRPKADYNKFFMADAALKLVRSGEIPESVIDDKVRRILRVGMNVQQSLKTASASFASPQHAAVALKVAREGIVLLKNTDHLLPFSTSGIRTLAVIGENADRPNGFGGGSSQVRARYEITPLLGLKKLMGSQTAIRYERGYTIRRNAKADPNLIGEAVAAAANADAVVIVGGWTHGYDYSNWNDNAYDAEDQDKPDMHLPFGQDELIEAVLAVNKNVVIVFYGGGPLDITRWESRAKAIIQAGYPGQEGGTALAEILLGKVNPSGKLPFSWPRVLEDAPAHRLGEYPGKGTTVTYKDDIYEGYRYFDTYKVSPQFAFGHGLSYTSFRYSNMKVTVTGNRSATLSVRVTNTGKVAGAEVVQVYVRDLVSSLPRPDKELKAFDKVDLAPGQSRTLTFRLGEEAFRFYDDTKGKWVVEPGDFQVLAGSASDDIRGTRTLQLRAN